MHVTPKNSSDYTRHGGKTFLQKYSGIFLGLFLVMFLVALCVSAYTIGILQIRPTDLVLKQQGCDLLQRYGVPAKSMGSSGACRVTVMFRSSIFADAVYLGDQRIELAQTEIVAIVPSSQEAPLTETQKRWVTICAAVIVLTVLMAVLNQLGSRRHK